ncbi:MAG: ABC transporter permease subunit [Nitrososphaerales archaeon]
MRRVKALFYSSLSLLCLLLLFIPLIWILVEATVRGGYYILERPLEFFTDIGRPPGIPGGGIGHALQGSLYLLAMALLIGAPLGTLTGIYTAERRNSIIAKISRFVSDVIVEFPTIIVGIVAYLTLASRITGIFNTGPAALIASFSLGLIMVPITARSVEATLISISNEIREGAYSLGLKDRQVLFRILIPIAKSGIVTALLIGLAKIAGESAPIIVSNGISNFWFSNWTEPAASIPVLIYVYGLSPFNEWQTLAWAASLILLLLVLGLGFLARMVTKEVWVRV